MILVFFLSFHNSKLWFRVGSFSELSFIFFFLILQFKKHYSSAYQYHNYVRKSRTYVLKYKKWQIEVLFGARNFFSVLFGGLSPFLSLVGPLKNNSPTPLMFNDPLPPPPLALPPPYLSIIYMGKIVLGVLGCFWGGLGCFGVVWGDSMDRPTNISN